MVQSRERRSISVVTPVYNGDVSLPNVRGVAVFGEKTQLIEHIFVTRFNLFEPKNWRVRKRMRASSHEQLAPFKIPSKIEVVTNEQCSERLEIMCARHRESQRDTGC